MTNKVIKMKQTGAGGRIVINPKASITYENCEELEAKFDESINHGKTEIIMDCKSVAYMDSEGLALLLRMHVNMKKKGGKLKLSGMNKVCRDILLATRLITVLHVYNDMQTAITDRI